MEISLRTNTGLLTCKLKGQDANNFLASVIDFIEVKPNVKIENLATKKITTGTKYIFKTDNKYLFSLDSCIYLFKDYYFTIEKN